MKMFATFLKLITPARDSVDQKSIVHQEPDLRWLKKPQGSQMDQEPEKVGSTAEPADGVARRGAKSNSLARLREIKTELQNTNSERKSLLARLMSLSGKEPVSDTTEIKALRRRRKYLNERITSLKIERQRLFDEKQDAQPKEPANAAGTKKIAAAA